MTLGIAASGSLHVIVSYETYLIVFDSNQVHFLYAVMCITNKCVALDFEGGNSLVRSGCPKRCIGVTFLAVVKRKSDLSMTCAAVSAFDIRKHGKMDSAFLCRREDFGMAKFTSVPDRVFLVREDNRVHPRITSLDRKILPVLHGRLFDG